MENEYVCSYDGCKEPVNVRTLPEGFGYCTKHYHVVKGHYPRWNIPRKPRQYVYGYGGGVPYGR